MTYELTKVTLGDEIEFAVFFDDPQISSTLTDLERYNEQNRFSEELHRLSDVRESQCFSIVPSYVTFRVQLDSDTNLGSLMRGKLWAVRQLLQNWKSKEVSDDLLQGRLN